MRKSKQPPKTSPPAGRILRTSAEQADWLFRLDRRRKLAYVTRVETACAEILREPETDLRRPYVARVQARLVVARGNLERGASADSQLVEIVALESRMRWVKFSAPRADAITRAVAALVQADPQAGPRAVWQRLAAQLGGQVSETASTHSRPRPATSLASRWSRCSP